MTLYLEIISGHLRGSRIRADDGMVIGRREGDLTIRDSKLSSKHARIEQRPDDSFWLVDLDSANGIKTQDSRVRTLQLVPGLKFTLGRTSFHVIAEPVADEISQARTMAAPRSGALNFWDRLGELSRSAVRKVKKLNREIAPFEPPLRLKFIQGIQTGEEWIIGYGPRVVGSHSVDLQLEDPRLPEICFRLVPEKGGILFKCESPSHIRLNGKSVVAELLRHDDVIDLETMQIRVNLNG